jgi:23S rRNA (adenine2503-C2)-methyltransferase
MSGNPLPDVRSLTKNELEQFFRQHSEKKFRANQVHDWLWKKPVNSFEGMTNLPKMVRQLLSDHFSLHKAFPETRQKSSDGTVKIGFRMHDHAS